MHLRSLLVGALLVALTACGNGQGLQQQLSECAVLGAGLQVRKPGDGMLVTVEVKFLEVEDSFLQSIGVDLNGSAPPLPIGNVIAGGTFGSTGFAVGSDVVGGAQGDTAVIPLNFEPETLIPLADPTTPSVGDVGVFVEPPGEEDDCNDVEEKEKQNVQGLPDNVAAAALSPNGAPTFALQFALLDDSQISIILNAISMSSSRNIVSSPPITLFNGQRATVTQFQFAAQASDLAMNGQQAVSAFIPQISNVFGGITLDVRPVVSSDRRYVRLNINPTASAAAAIIIPPVTIGTNTTTVQLPIFQPITVKTFVSVPDGGTVLLGGIKEPGMPVLSKIPYINRLFKNVGIGSTAQSLMIMVTPRIIIQEEEEE